MQQKRSILITGCSSGGAGHALALEFAAHGLRVFATARSTRSLTELEEKGIETLALDVTSAESIAALKKEIISRTGGKLDMLFNNAGTLYEAPAVESDPRRVRGMFDANVFGLFDMISAFTPLLLAAVPDSRDPPTIINTASILARIPYVFGAAYNATKAAVVSYSDTLRIEVAPLGIKVVTLYMGEVSTGLMVADNISFGADSLYSDIEGEVKKRSITHVKSTMKPDEFARQVVREVLVKKPGPGSGEFVWKGTNALIIWFLNAFAWRKVFDSIVEGPVGLNNKANRKLIFEKGQSKAKEVL
ncbi:Glucose/ribitol dehydrogenase [Pleurostoma richardsiae]|uniref:Glucose/ribitol dehydrogenase n=1 Tax=Pleurostoma richardsiae TaxID=41990 RepID=A0AA38S5J2_9PEZI|nr:Glucose/ribitol dehydrogenase [Pleurostoma richardsiae]